MLVQEVTISGLSAAAQAAVGLRHRPAGLVFSARRKENGGGIVLALRRGEKKMRGEPVSLWQREGRATSSAGTAEPRDPVGPELHPAPPAESPQALSKSRTTPRKVNGGRWIIIPL